MFEQYLSECTDKVVEAIHRGVADLVKLQRRLLTPEFVLLGLLELDDTSIHRMLEDLGMDEDEVIRAVADSVLLAELKPEDASEPEDKQVHIQISQEVVNVMNAAKREAQSLGDKFVSTGALFLGLLDATSGSVSKLLADAGLRYGPCREALQALRGTRTIDRRDDESREDVLAQYTTDLTALARAGELDPVIGREDEIFRVIEILSRRKKNNPVLIGEPGVGKTVIVEGLAQRIVDADVPDVLLGRRLLALDMAGLVAGAGVRGEFEQRMTDVRDEIIAEGGKVILFIDELHTVVGAGGGGGGIDASNILKPALARGLLQCIGAATLQDYRRFVEADKALERRFQSILVREPSADETVAILSGLKKKYEDHHKITFDGPALKAAAVMAERYLTERCLPDKAVDLIDEAGSRKHLDLVYVPSNVRSLERRLDDLKRKKEEVFREHDFERTAKFQAEILPLEDELAAARKAWEAGRTEQSSVVEADDVARVVARWTGIPVDRVLESEVEKLVNLEDRLHERIVGQAEAVAAVCNAIRRNRAGLKEATRPVGSFLFLGPTGVGKTELARALAELLFDDEARLIRLDLSEFMERHEVSKLIGSPPGYVGYGEGGQLTERIRRNPYAVVLLDEIEKAHPDFFNMLLQIFDEGRLTDAQGQTVSFRNAIVIGTSNLGSRKLVSSKALGFGGSDRKQLPFAEARRLVLEEARRFFKPEFLNRVDELIVFHALDEEHIHKIVRMLLARLEKRLQERGITLAFDDGVIEKLARDGFNPLYGARPLRREIEKQVEDALAPRILKGDFGAGSTVHVHVDGESLRFE